MNPDDSADRLPSDAAAAANRDARLHPPAPALGGGQPQPARIELAGAVLGFSVTPGGDLAISVDLTEAAEWLRAPEGTVSLLLTSLLAAGEQTVFAGRLLPPDPPPDPDASPGRVVIPLYGPGRPRPHDYHG